MLRQRVISAVVLIPAIFFAIWLAPYWLFTLLFGSVILLAVHEFFKIVRYTNVRPFAAIGLIVTAVFITYAYFSGHTDLSVSVHILPLLGAAVSLTAYIVYFLHRFKGRPGAATVIRWLWTVAGVIYVGWLGSHFILLRGVDGWDVGRKWIILALFATFAADTLAYFIGRAWGRHKMAPSISPGKTWEGAAGGFFGGLGATVLLAYILDFEIGWKLILLGCLIPVFAVLGDLVES